MSVTLSNAEILKAPAACLSNLDRQRQYVLQRAAQDQLECPACQKSSTQLAAAGLDIADYPVNGLGYPDFRCPHCGRAVVLLVPFMGPNRWGLREPLPPVEGFVPRS